MMGTRAAAFTAKIRHLLDYHIRIQQNIIPLVSGTDVANTLKYFSQTLLSVLKDVPTIPLDVMCSSEKDHYRTSLFPCLDYKALYHAVIQLVDTVPLVQYGAQAMGHNILYTLVCLVPFLEHEYMDTLPYIVASSMALFPSSLHRDIVDTLCNHLLWFTFRDSSDIDNQNYTYMSTSAVIMMVFQYSESSALRYQLLECLMSMKRDVMKDMFCVIAHGTAKARSHAIELLFQYWPSLNKCIHERKGLAFKHHGWKPLMCQQENCLNPVNNEAVKMCFDHVIAIGSGEHAPPLHVCQDCADQIHREHGSHHLFDVLLPIQHVSTVCENKNCHSIENAAVGSCFSIECTSKNGNRPIKYCKDCLLMYHQKTDDEHMVHGIIPNTWEVDLETQCYMVEAIISLLREAQPDLEKPIKDCAGDKHNLPDNEDDGITSLDERQLLSQFGIWLLVGLCTPNEDTPVETLGRLLSMLFQWFHYTACLPDDQAGNALERLKTEYIHGWLMGIVKTHFDVFVSCLLPHPAEYSQVGGHWDTWPSQTYRIKEGFKRLLCLVPYDIITPNIWEHIMPFWMEAFRYEIPEEELSEFKILLSKVLDPDLSPLGFSTEEMYRFLSSRFDNSTAPVQEQALYWLQILTMLEVPVPLSLIMTMFSKGVKSTIEVQEEEAKGKMSKVIPRQHNAGKKHEATKTTSGGEESNNAGDEFVQSPSIDYRADAEINLTCFILMIDTLIKQLELQEVPPHKGLEQPEAQKMMILLHDIIRAPWVGVHTCNDSESDKEDGPCLFCEICAVWYQLATVVIEYFSPKLEVTMADIPTDTHRALDSPIHISHAWKGEETNHIREDRAIESKSVEENRNWNFQQLDENHSLGKRSADDSISHFPIKTATVQECAAELDTVAIMPTENVVTAYAHAVTLTEDDVARATCTVVSATLVDENDQKVTNLQKTDDGFWHTSQGKFKFALEDLPPQLQLLYVLLKELDESKDADVLYHILLCLKLMCLHSEVLNKAAHEYRGFLIWSQENLLIPNLWKLLQAEFSHISQLSIALLLHCVTLPCGTDVFWKVIECDFHNDNWRAVFAAVEKVTMIAHFVDTNKVKNSPLLQSSLANAFTYLVRCLDDPHQVIAQRSLLNLETIRTSSLKLFLWCLEVQFDSVILDRPMILQTVYQLYNHISDRRFLTWDFFLNRFDALFLEAQINLDLQYTRDLKNTNIYSDVFQRKLNRAHEALSHNAHSRSLFVSIASKWPYKRALSAPGGMISKQEKWVDKDKIYSRQSSAPVLKRKSSKLMVGMHSGQLTQHLPNSFFSDGQGKEMAQEETHLLHIMQRVMDMEDHDKETLHLLIFVLMQFLATPDQFHPTEGKIMGRNQSLVLRHINLLLGYSPTEKGFLIPPYKLRSSPVFNAFLTSLPKVLDFNFKMGTILLSTCLPVLIYCPSPQRFSHEPQPPNYSLWLLHPFVRHSWLMAIMVIMYKYNYTSPPQSKQVEILVHIILNTLDAHQHHCKGMVDPILSPAPSRSRDLSTTSGDLENIQERESPPWEPLLSADEGKVSVIGSQAIFCKMGGLDVDENEYDKDYQRTNKEKTERQQWKIWKPLDMSCSSDGEEIEPELEAIPESPKSETSDTKKDTSESIRELEILPKEHLIEKATVQVVPESTIASEKVAIISPMAESNQATIFVNKGYRRNDVEIASDINDNITKGGTSISRFPASEEFLGEQKQDNDLQIIEKSLHEHMEKSSISNTEKSNNANELYSSDMADDINSKKLHVMRASTADSRFSENIAIQHGIEHSNIPQFPEFIGLQDSNQSHLKTQFDKNKDSIVPLPTYCSLKMQDVAGAKTNEIKSLDNAFDTSKHLCSSIAAASEIKQNDIRTPVRTDSFIKSSNKTSQQLHSLQDSSKETKDLFHAQLDKMKEHQFLKNKSHLIKLQSKHVDGKDKSRLEASHHQFIEEKPISYLQDDVKHKSSRSDSKHSPAKKPWKIDFHSPVCLQPLIPKPTPERLLPIGPTKDSEISDFDQTDVKISDNEQSSEVACQGQLSGSPETSTASTLPELISLQALTTGDLNVPTPERLLPVGTITTKKVSDGIENVSCQEKKLTAKLSGDDHLTFSASSVVVDPDSHPFSKDNIQLETELLKEAASKQEKLSIELKETSKNTLEVSSIALITPPFNELLDIDTKRDKQHAVSSQDVVSDMNKTPLFKVGTASAVEVLSTEKQGISEEMGVSKIKKESIPDVLNKVSSLPSVEKPSDKDTNYDDDHIIDRFQIPYEGLRDFVEKGRKPVEQQHVTEAPSHPLIKHDSLDNKDDDVTPHPIGEKVEDDMKGRLHYRQRKQRKIGLGTVEMQRAADAHIGISRRTRKTDHTGTNAVGFTSKRSSTSQPSSTRHLEDKVADRCNDCGGMLEEYSDEELGLCIVVLSTFIHREPELAAPLLPEILKGVVRIASCTMYAWQSESNTHLPGSAVSVARQFLRCTLHQLAQNDVFVQIFQSQFDAEFFKTIAAALADFIELNQVSPLLFLFESLNERKHLIYDNIMYILMNVDTYLNCLPVESNILPWSVFLPQYEMFLRKFLLILPLGACDLTSIICIMKSVLKMPVISSCKSILDPFSKILCHAIQYSLLHYADLLEICQLCNHNLPRERDKQTLSRTMVFELIQALKFKSSIPDDNLLTLVQLLLQDVEGILVPTVIVDSISADIQNKRNTGLSECMRQHLHDALEFVADIHTLTKLKSNFHGTSSQLNEETLGGQLKAGIAQYLAIEISKGNGRDNRAVGKYLPWLYHPPSLVQQGPKEFIDCVAHIRLLSWLLLGALMHGALLQNTANAPCQPVPMEANGHIAEHIQVILAGFAEQSKASVLHMSSLFHAFILCQLWTMYCEHMIFLNPPGSEQNQLYSLSLTDFWAKVTPGILQLICHSKVLAEMVSLHFLCLMEALMECNSTVLARLLPMWTPVLYSYQGQLPGHLQVRLQACLNWKPPVQNQDMAATLLKWLQRLQFKMGQIELQSSAATQFYSL